ncbi:class I adenylate-forming enzyme family protein [Paraburkholderia sartisoli]|uniref:Malonyl-CoA/methylmalonyl-CoA synthetase n=1 Tax=Paraburkholderia sartisoli TaxID=83784 RepID=A0A1H4CLY9_9BURK|nr:class I adenylate-forming enzyme family protein [Paraburkholderia sartisoli]SEA61339.1 malonyl-CoA/methylmalonyl-CoA synthetase [Paraburkholderia sartisoli]
MPGTGHPLADPPFQSVGALLDAHRRRAPDKAAIVDVEHHATVSFGELAAVVDALGRQLQRHGARKGSRIVLASTEGLEKLLLWLGIWRIGAVACPLDIAFVGPDVAGKLLDMLDPSLILLPLEADASVVPRTNGRLVRFDTWPAGSANENREDVIRFTADSDESGTPFSFDIDIDLTDIASMCCTSGTTGMPKVVVYDHACYWLNGLDSIDLLGLNTADRALEYRSFDWYSAQILSLMPFLQLGSTLCVARRFSRSQFAGWIRDNRVTVCAGVPTVLNMLLDSPVDVSGGSLASLRVMTCSTAPLSPVQWERFEAHYGIHVLNLYGSSEAGWMCGNRSQRRKLGTVGYPAAHIGFTIVSPDGSPCGPGQEGQVVVSGPKLALGLLRADRSIEPLRGTALHTRDVASQDDEGFVRVSGRMDDLIIRGGVKIVPQEIEDALLAHAGVQDAVALGVPDPIYGQESVCFVVPHPGSILDARELLTHCRARLPREKLPRHVYVVESLPRSARGKILRDALRREWWTITHAPGT